MFVCLGCYFSKIFIFYFVFSSFRLISFSFHCRISTPTSWIYNNNNHYYLKINYSKYFLLSGGDNLSSNMKSKLCIFHLFTNYYTTGLFDIKRKKSLWLRFNVLLLSIFNLIYILTTTCVCVLSFISMDDE